MYFGAQIPLYIGFPETRMNVIERFFTTACIFSGIWYKYFSGVPDYGNRYRESFSSDRAETKLRHWPPGTNRVPFVPSFFLSLGAASLRQDRRTMKSHIAGRVLMSDAASRRRLLLRIVLLGACYSILLLSGLKAFHYEWQREMAALRSMRNLMEQTLAPGEVVLVDDRMLGWALGRGDNGTLRQSVWTLGRDVTTDSLLPRLVREQRREMIVLATPDGDLVRRLDAAGFSVAQEVGWVPWDMNGKGRTLFGRGKKRLYFAVAPKGANTAKAGETISSEAK
jgi:hypothetical protein